MCVLTCDFYPGCFSCWPDVNDGGNNSITSPTFINSLLETLVLKLYYTQTGRHGSVSSAQSHTWFLKSCTLPSTSLSPHRWPVTSCSCHQGNVGVRLIEHSTHQHVNVDGQWGSWPSCWILSVLLNGVTIPAAIALSAHPAETAKHAAAYGWAGKEEEVEDGSREKSHESWRHAEEWSKRKNKTVT